MARPSAGRDGSSQLEAGLARPLQRIANLLGLILVKGENEAEKVLTLTAAGFSVAEVASLLGKDTNTVSVMLYQARKGLRRKKRTAARGGGQ